ncbi:uncharacterized protein LOC125475586 [Pyrus x bretschneideri]|uniref:uncharacterized protein LOC125475586 n=1 Tax=Pyrus x bretschneideri TaxID=225117 RepID=UPI0020308433|nr:uncharacterized protein LOC125475586 [Pyrus x bretschneideri]
MANLPKLDFVALEIIGKNYFTKVVDARIHLEEGNLGGTIKEDKNASSQDRAKAMIFIRCHLEGLKSKYLTVEDPLDLWKTVAVYNSAMFRISCQMKLCGETTTEEDMLEKNFSTFMPPMCSSNSSKRARLY